MRELIERQLMAEYLGNGEVRHCVRRKKTASGKRRCAKYAEGPGKGGAKVGGCDACGGMCQFCGGIAVGGAKPRKSKKHARKGKKGGELVYGEDPSGGFDMSRYMPPPMFDQLPRLGAKALQALKKQLGMGELAFGGAPVGGTAAQKRAAKRNPWLKFLKQYEKVRPDLLSDRVAFVKAASRAYKA